MANRWLALWLWLAALLVSAGASAQSPHRAVRPADLLQGVAVPPPPAGWVEVHDGETTWQAAPEARSLLDTLRTSTASDRRRVLAELGQDEAPLLVRLGRNPDEMAQLAPMDAPPPPYAVGVTYPGLALVVLAAATAGVVSVRGPATLSPRVVQTEVVRVRAGTGLTAVGRLFWVAINDQPANPWDY